MFSRLMSIKSYGKIGLLVLATSVGITLPSMTQAYDAVAQENLNQLVNINSADMSELSSLKGIGHQKALAIIAYRDQMGKFTSIDELLKVKGIGDKVLSGIKNQITI